MRTEVIRIQTSGTATGRVRYGSIRDFASEIRNESQNSACLHSQAFRPNPKPPRLFLTARAYQLELFTRAKTQNTIAVVDTGAGKTFIAALLIQHELHREEVSISRSITERTVHEDSGRASKRLIFFVVDKVALALQQTEFLQRTCPGKIGVLFGALGVENYSLEQWKHVYTQYDVVVLTADIMKDCLARKILHMSSISLLLYDECHHARKAHPYALIQEFYHAASPQQRPRIFGMTASPIGSRGPPAPQAHGLEQILDAKICTPERAAVSSGFDVRPNEYFCVFDATTGFELSTLMDHDLQDALACISSVARRLRIAIDAGRVLGLWAFDSMLKLFLEEVRWRHEAKLRLQGSSDLIDLQGSVSEVERVEKKLCSMLSLSSRSAKNSMTAKVRRLVSIINRIYKDVQCNSPPIILVFCERRATAYLLLQLCDTSCRRALPNALRASLFIGHGSSDEGDICLSTQRQALVVDQFRNGTINCLFATSVAEEGIDIPACQYVVRFDDVTNLTQYIQSRGRARKVNSFYITLMAAGDTKLLAAHRHIKEREEISRNFCQSLSADRIVSSHEEELVATETFSKAGSIPSFSAINVVSTFCHTLPADEFISIKPTFMIASFEGRGFRATCVLPTATQISPIAGRISKSKRGAKMDAAQRVVEELLRRELLDEHYNPVLHRSLSAMTDEGQDPQLKPCNMKNQWVIRDPTFWNREHVTQYNLTRIIIENWPSGHDRKLPNLLLVTKQPLPSMPTFPFWHKRSAFHMCCKNFEGTVHIPAEKVEILKNFTVRLFKFMVRKLFYGDIADHAYFLAIETGSDVIDRAIDWDQMVCCETDAFETILLPVLIHNYEDCLIKHKHYDSFYEVTGVVKQESLGDPVNQADQATVGRKSTNPPDAQNSHTRSSNYIICARPLRRTLNYLTARKDEKSELPKDNPCSQCTLEPEDYLKVNMRASILTAAYLFPSFSVRLDSFLHAIELNRSLSAKIELQALVDAITLRQAQHGCDYERYEFLGDAYLKFITTVAVYIKYPIYHEGLLTMQRTTIIENRNLRRLAISRKLASRHFGSLLIVQYEFVRCHTFNKRAWRPPFLAVFGEPDLPSRLQVLSNKQLADVVEAILGAALHTCGFDHALHVARALGIETYGMYSWDAARRMYAQRLPLFLSRPRRVPGLSEIESLLEYQFETAGYAEQALRHGSCPIDPDDVVPSYQRLEFIGDAVLEIEVAKYLFQTFPGHNPDQLTNIKSHLVRNKNLGSLLESLNIQRHMRHFHGGIPSAMSEYSKQLAHLKQLGTKADYYSDCDPPKFMSDIFEALLGSIFLDNQMNTSPVTRVLLKYLIPRLTACIDYATKRPVMEKIIYEVQISGCQKTYMRRYDHPPKSILDHRIVHKHLAVPRNITLVLCMHDICFCVVRASSQNLAKLQLAERVLDQLEVFRTTLRRLCTCTGLAACTDTGINDGQYSRTTVVTPSSA